MNKVYGQCKKCGKNLRQRGIAASGICRACQWDQLRAAQRVRERVEPQMVELYFPALVTPNGRVVDPAHTERFNLRVNAERRRYEERKREHAAIYAEWARLWLPKERWLCVRAFGLAAESYVGMGGVRSGFVRRCVVSEVWRSFEVLTAPGLIERTMNATRKTWPEWLPVQEPEFELYVWEPGSTEGAPPRL